MSATPEVAFEAIIREEFNLIEKRRAKIKESAEDEFSKALEIAEIEKQKAQEELELSKTLFFLGQSRPKLYADGMLHYQNAGNVMNKLSYDNLKAISDRELVCQLEQQVLEIYFYYLSRDYSYIEKVIPYKDENKVEDKNRYLISKITEDKSSDKWMVFVSSKKDGENLEKALNSEYVKSNDVESKSKKAIFISSQNKESDPEIKKAFDFIVKNSKFEQKVLISTSVLDNGINIKDLNVRNIAIDIYDRTEFIQMLGRLRIEDTNQKVNLYIKTYEHKDLKSMAKKAASNLIHRLWIDCLSVEQKKQIFIRKKDSDTILDSELYRLSNIPSKFCEYNPCAIYQLITFISLLMKVIRKTEPEFCIEYETDEPESVRAKLVHYYVYGNGKDMPWSRSVVDILGSKEDMQKRERLEKSNVATGNVSMMYLYTFSDTFLNYLYGEAIPQYLNEAIHKNIELLFINTFENEYGKNQAKNSFDVWSARLKDRYSKSVNFEYDVWNFIYNDFSEKQKRRFSYLNEILTEMAKKIKFYKKLVTGYSETPLSAQYQWIEQAYVENSASDMFDEYSDEYFKKKITTTKEIESHKHCTKEGKETEYYEEHFLYEYGIKKDSKPELAFRKKYLDNASTTSKLSTNVVISDISCKIESRRSQGEGHKTYYLLVRQQG